MLTHIKTKGVITDLNDQANNCLIHFYKRYLIVSNMADLDDFFAKKDKKKKGTKKFSKANTDVIAKNLEESAIKEQKQQDKEMTNMGEDKNPEKINQQVCF